MVGKIDAETYARYGNGDLSGVSLTDVNKYAPKAEVWLGEGGGQGCGEGDTSQQVWSNTAKDLYWWLDALGNTAAHGHQRFLRETLAGGWYGMVNLTSMQVYPDYYAALLFTRLMGPTVLNASITQSPMPDPKAPVRVYAHCHRSHGLTVLLINLSNETSVNVSVQPTHASPREASSYQLYRLQMGLEGTRSHTVKLNGKVLELGPTGELPAMPSVRGTGPVVLAPLDIAFCVVDLPSPDGSVCPQ